MRRGEGFFSCLKQVEKRLKVNHTNSNPTQNSESPSPLYFNTGTPFPSDNSTENPPREFLSNTQNPSPLPLDDVDSLMQLLGPSDFDFDFDFEGKRDMPDCGGDEFYEKIAGVRGPKCQKQAERLDGWIEHFRNNRTEVLRLTHLLLAKAAFHQRHGLRFPSTVDEFLHNDPPAD